MGQEPKRPIQGKARGKKLITRSKKTLQNIPPEFLAEAGMRIEKQPVATEVVPDEAFAADQIGSSVEMDNTTQSQKIDEFLDQDLPVTLIDSVMTPEGQLGTRTRTLDAGTQTITPSATMKEGQVENKGADRSIATTVVVPDVFGKELFAKERPDLVPEEFRGIIPAETTRVDSAGVAAMPTLVAGDIARSSEQVTEFVKRDTQETRADVTLPVVLTDSVITPEGQVGTRLRTYDNGPQPIVPDALLKEGEDRALGDGRSVQTKITVPTVFGKQLFSIERPEVIPTAFRSAVPLVTTSLQEAGIASLPSLGINDIERSMRQITEFIRETIVRTRTLPGSFPTITLRSFDSDLQSEILTTLDIVAMGSSYTPVAGVVDYDEKELDDNYSLRTVYMLPGTPGTPTLPSGYNTREPGSRRFPALLTDITVAKIQIADDGDGNERYEVRWFPIWRPGFTIEVNYVIETTFHFTEPSPDPIYAIVTNDILYSGVSFSVNLQSVLNDTLTAKGVSFTDDGIYGNLSENFSVAASTPSASDYTSQIGQLKVLASKVQPWRRLWVKRTTKVTLL